MAGGGRVEDRAWSCAGGVSRDIEAGCDPFGIEGGGRLEKREMGGEAERPPTDVSERRPCLLRVGGHDISNAVLKAPADAEREAEGVDAGVGVGLAAIRMVDEVRPA